jgi:hypothetical protein
MKRSVVMAGVLLAFIVSVSLLAQSPKGWMVRADRSTSASDPDAAGAIKFVTMGTGFHATNPQAAVYWNPANKMSGNYTLKGTFTLVKPSNHTNYYGLVFGGNALDGPMQTYTYFLVAQDGTFLIKQRNGEQTSDIKTATKNAVIKTPDSSGKSVNALEVRVAGDTVSYVVNGTVVHTTPKSAVKSDGIAGFRVNHVTEVMVDNFEVQKG